MLAAERARQARLLSHLNHDLQSPLNHVLACADILNEELGEAATKDARWALDHIIEGAQRLSLRIEGLVRCGRLPTAELELAAVAVEPMVQAALTTAQARHGVAVRASVTGALEVEADAALLEQAIGHLVDNAVKYGRADAERHIEVVARAAPEGWLLEIHDDGVGYDETQSEHLFTPFRRLHSPSEYPGEGLGLPLAEAVARAHGGTCSTALRPEGGVTQRLWIPVPPGRDSPAAVLT